MSNVDNIDLLYPIHTPSKSMIGLINLLTINLLTGNPRKSAQGGITGLGGQNEQK